MTTFFTADTHFQHKGKPVEQNGSGGILRMARRPFVTIEAHDAELIRRWNSKVKPGDTVWHCGDFAMGQQANVPAIVEQLNGDIHLVWGNHDKRRVHAKFTCFKSTQDVATVRIDKDHSVFLSHYAHRVWNKAHYGRYHFFGHSHGGMPPMARSLDVGVDCWDYYPVTFDEIVSRLQSLGLNDVVVRHHGDRSSRQETEE
jgi:calcineurin-like phosphoesterase family protein